jgi:predicted metal-dependent phosphoesterase TrpH
VSRPTFDLQSHSVYSDGSLRPSEVVRLAAADGVELLALSDHDSVDGVTEALAAAEQFGVRIVPAVEITAVDDQQDDIHLLGYMVDHTDLGLLNRLGGARQERLRRSHLMAEKLERAGWSIDLEFLRLVEAEGGAVGRPHLAEALLRDPENAQRAAEAGFQNVGDVIEALISRGKEGFVARENPTVEEAIGWVHEAGGLAVYAHPMFPRGEFERERVRAAVSRYCAAGLDGIECFYTTHTEDETRFLHALAVEHGLLTTGSTDFHGPDHGHFSKFRDFQTYGLEVNLGALDLS